MVDNLFLCYRRAGAQTAKLFKKYIERHHFECRVWYSDLEIEGNFKEDIKKKIYDEAKAVLIFASKGFVDNFLENDGMECITAAEIKMIAKKKQDCPEFRIIVVNLDDYAFDEKDEAVLTRLLEDGEIRDPKVSAQQISMSNHNVFRTAVDDEETFFDDLVKIIFPERSPADENLSSRLSKHMDEFSEEYNIFEEEAKLNSYYWGADKTLLKCHNIFEGWSMSQIIIDDIDTSEYVFPEEDWRKGAEEYNESDEAKRIRQRGENKTRWMISEFESSYETGDLHLCMRKTNWCTNQYVWKRLRENEEERRQYLSEMEEGNDELLPNSFCLHLVVTDANDNVLLTRIERKKKNDYPNTIAATIGEQIEFEDFGGEDDMRPGFVERWVERAIIEEFGIGREDYKVFVDVHSICPLALTAEGDIYNIALVTSVKLFCGAEKLETRRRDEFREIIPLPISEIPALLARYQCKKDTAAYHPSTFLRLFLCYIHRKGTGFFEQEYSKALRAEQAEDGREGNDS